MHLDRGSSSSSLHNSPGDATGALSCACTMSNLICSTSRARLRLKLSTGVTAPVEVIAQTRMLNVTCSCAEGWCASSLDCWKLASFPDCRLTQMHMICKVNIKVPRSSGDHRLWWQAMA